MTLWVGVFTTGPLSCTMVSMTTETYVKGSLTRIVSTARERVKATFEGFKPAASETADRSVLQARAKELGIKATQSNEALTAAIGAVDGEPTVAPDEQSETLGQAPETNDGGSPLDPETP